VGSPEEVPGSQVDITLGTTAEDCAFPQGSHLQDIGSIGSEDFSSHWVI
jgi:hypothetical protein